MRVSSDSERFQAWLEDVFEARQHDAETIAMGPYRAVILRDEGKPSAWVTLVAAADDSEGRSALTRLRSAFSRQDFEIEFEYDAEAFPQARQWFEAAGLTLVETNPLMACRPASFRPFAAPGVSMTRLGEHGREVELEAFQRIRWTDGGDVDRAYQPVEKLRRDLRNRTSVFLLAWLDWEPVGTGVSHLTKETAEIVGVVTRNDRRRRGVAATVTSELVVRHFDRGGDFVFLDAADDGAVKVYERLGFTRFGSKALYR